MPSMERYRRVKTETEKTESQDDEIRISTKGNAAKYVAYASKLINEKEMTEFTLKATGAALVTAVTVAEVIKRRFKGLHQITTLGSVEIEDLWEPIEEGQGLEPVTGTRSVSVIEITLSKDKLDTTNKGYQEPLPEDQVKELDQEELLRGPRRGGGNKTEDGEGEEKPRNRGKGRGRGSRGGGSKEGADHEGSEKKSKGGKKGKGKGKGKRGGKGKGKRSSKDRDDDDE